MRQTTLLILSGRIGRGETRKDEACSKLLNRQWRGRLSRPKGDLANVGQTGQGARGGTLLKRAGFMSDRYDRGPRRCCVSEGSSAENGRGFRDSENSDAEASKNKKESLGKFGFGRYRASGGTGYNVTLLKELG